MKMNSCSIEEHDVKLPTQYHRWLTSRRTESAEMMSQT